MFFVFFLFSSSRPLCEADNSVDWVASFVLPGWENMREVGREKGDVYSVQ